MAALGACSHCFKEPATESACRTTNFENIYLDPATVTRKVRHWFPFKAIFYDIDGSLTGLEPGSWAITRQHDHNLWENECWEDDSYDGYLCVHTVTVRRLLIYNYWPENLRGTEICVLKYDESIIGGHDGRRNSDI